MARKKQNTFARWREELDLSISEISNTLGLSQSQVANLLRGKDGKGRPAIPRPDTLLLMAVARAGLAVKPVELTAEEAALARDASRSRRVRRAQLAMAA